MSEHPADPLTAAGTWGFPVSAGALVWDPAGRLLILDPTYKAGWTLPGGVMEPTGETPWQACCREVHEECGLVVTSGRLAAVDTRPATARQPVRLRLLFDCGRLDEEAFASIRLDQEEIGDYRLLPPHQALPLLRPAVGRRVGAALASPQRCVYLEDGRPVPGLGGGP